MRKFSIKLIFLFFTFYFLLFTFPHPAFAADEIGQSKIYPAHPLYFLKKVREILELKFAPTSEMKAARYLEFAQRRIREVKALVETRHFEMIAPTLEHYLFNLQKVLGLMDLKNEAKAKQVADTVYMHLQNLEDIYSKIDHEAARRSIRTTMFKISQWSRQSKICDFLIKEASSSALNEVEIEVLRQRANTCLQGLK